ncbi:helix-turn-helix domain-containing protein, partial [Streptomyces montanisoli]
MPPRSNPTARQQRLGAELRKLREEAGLSTEQAAALLDTKRTVITSTEAGRHGVSPERVRRMAFRYECTDSDLVNALVAMCGDRTGGWWDVSSPGFCGEWVSWFSGVTQGVRPHSGRPRARRGSRVRARRAG